MNKHVKMRTNGNESQFTSLGLQRDLELSTEGKAQLLPELIPAQSKFSVRTLKYSKARVSSDSFCVYIYISIYIYISRHLYIYIDTCIYTHTHTHKIHKSVHVSISGSTRFGSVPKLKHRKISIKFELMVLNNWVGFFTYLKNALCFKNFYSGPEGC